MNIIEKTQAYRASPALNQSKLNQIRTGFKKVNVNDGMTLGNILEVEMCYPEMFDQLFVIGKVPKGKAADIIKELVEDGIDLDNMTDEQIKDFYGDSSNFDLVGHYVISFARAIEAAHGIGGEQ